MNIEWTKITNDNVPNVEVLAIGYQNEMIVGYVSGDDEIGFLCDSEDNVLEEVTHFIECSKLVKLLKTS